MVPLGRHSPRDRCGWCPPSCRWDPTLLPVHSLRRRRKWLRGKTLWCPGHAMKRLVLAGSSVTRVGRRIASVSGVIVTLDLVRLLPRRALEVWSAGAHLRARQELPLSRNPVPTRALHIPPLAARQSLLREVALVATAHLPLHSTGAALCLGWTMRVQWHWCPEWPAEAFPSCPISQQWEGLRRQWGHARTQARHCC